MELIKSTEITLHSGLHGIDKTFKISRYPATEGVYLIGMAVEVLGSTVSPSGADKVSSKKVQEFVIEVCKYVEAQTDGGDFVRLNQKLLIDAHVPDYELLMLLVREVHDWNSNFFNTDRILKGSLSLMDKAKHLITKTLIQYSPSSKAKK